MPNQDALVLQLSAGLGQGLEPVIEKDNVAVRIGPATIVTFARFAKEKLGFDLLTSITAIDNGREFELQYHFVSIRPTVGEEIAPAYPGYLLARVAVPRTEAEPVVPSVTSIYPGANQQEREIYDLMGIRFKGHPKLERILLWEGFPGHPLRKDWRPLNAEIPWHLAGLTGFGGTTMENAPAVAQIADDGSGFSQPIPVGTTPESFQYPATRDPKPEEMMRIRIGQGGIIDGETASGPGRVPGIESPGGKPGPGLEEQE
ncbi:MAG: NADH-quinone oxidoreductase subunit C [Candidatus Dormibacteria bacterium]